jgi:1-phosphatidylinositol-4-phosphate 5-kinase
MVFLERVLSTFAVIQTIVASIRSGSRAAYILKGGAIGVMEGPLIMPPDSNATERSPLYDIATAFRYSVELALHPHRYETAYHVDNNRADGAEHSETPTPTNKLVFSPSSEGDNDGSTSSTLQLLVDDLDNDDILDQAIEALIQKQELETTSEPNASVFATRIRHAVAKEFSAGGRLLVRPFAYIATRSRLLWKRVRCTWKLEEDKELSYFSTSVTVDDCLLPSLLPSINHASTANESTRIARIRAYAPACFADLRSQFGISEESFQRSILQTGPFVSFQSNSKGAARAGLVFFFTRDGAYMIKTIKKGEVQTFLQMLPAYYHFMQRHGRRSLLTRFCGMYQVSLRDETANDSADEYTHTIVVMNSVFPAEAAKFLSERFDLKGSTVGRECSTEEHQSKGSEAVLKDLDLVHEAELVRSFERKGLGRPRGHGDVIAIGPTEKSALLSQLKKDVGLLVECNVIDYSLLVGVVNMETHEMEFGPIESPLRQLVPRKPRLTDNVMTAIVTTIRFLMVPSRQVWSTVEKALSWPLPYYGSGECVVDGGKLANVHGERRGQRAIFYFGLIDFLQPWDFKKTIEWKAKGLFYQAGSYSCVPPDQYADRFLKFVDDYVS